MRPSWPSVRRPRAVVFTGWSPSGGETRGGADARRLAGPPRRRAPRGGDRHDHGGERGPNGAAPPRARASRGDGGVHGAPPASRRLLLPRGLRALRDRVSLPLAGVGVLGRGARVGAGWRSRSRAASAGRCSPSLPGRTAQARARGAGRPLPIRPGCAVCLLLLLAIATAVCRCRLRPGRLGRRCPWRTRAERARAPVLSAPTAAVDTVRLRRYARPSRSMARRR